jgi:hypothetical protein
MVMASGEPLFPFNEADGQCVCVRVCVCVCVRWSYYSLSTKQTVRVRE